jgi:hypothetical protein
VDRFYLLLRLTTFSIGLTRSDVFENVHQSCQVTLDTKLLGYPDCSLAQPRMFRRVAQAANNRVRQTLGRRRITGRQVAIYAVNQPVWHSPNREGRRGHAS